MNFWVITGSMGTGKSLAMKLLHQQCGDEVAVVSADTLVHYLLNTPHVLSRLFAEFGANALREESGITVADRQWLRDHVFSSDEQRHKLEGLLHPMVLQELEERRSAAQLEGRNLFLAEVPLHYEIQKSVSADLVIVVASSHSVQLRRLMESRGLDETIIKKMLSAQWPIEAKVERADVVIWNDGSMAALEAQTLSLTRQLRLE